MYYYYHFSTDTAHYSWPYVLYGCDSLLMGADKYAYMNKLMLISLYRRHYLFFVKLPLFIFNAVVYG